MSERTCLGEGCSVTMTGTTQRCEQCRAQRRKDTKARENRERWDLHRAANPLPDPLCGECDRPFPRRPGRGGQPTYCPDHAAAQKRAQVKASNARMQALRKAAEVIPTVVCLDCPEVIVWEYARRGPRRCPPHQAEAKIRVSNEARLIRLAARKAQGRACAEEGCPTRVHHPGGQGSWPQRCPTHIRDRLTANFSLRAAFKRMTWLPETAWGEHEPVSLLLLAERDDYHCGICGNPVVDMSARRPDPDMPTIDHIIPVTMGGAHNYANTRLAHDICNAKRGNHGTY